jgi:inorganic triphosphatase YgiF
VTGPSLESELKFLAADERPLRELAERRRLGPALLGPSTIAVELDRYLDTADLRLAAARWACRLRTRDGRAVLSLKGPAGHDPGDLVHRRPELEGPAGPGLDPHAWEPSAAKKRLLAMSGGAPLVERFVLEQQRTERAVSVDGRQVGSLSLDLVRVLFASVELGQLLVVELEFRPGPVDAAAPDLTDALLAVPGLAIDPLSKLEHALAMLPVA